MPFGLRALAGVLAGRAAHRVAAAGRRALFFLFGILCLMVTVGFLAAALFTWLDATYGIFAAELGLAAVFLVLGLVFLLAAAYGGREKRVTNDGLGMGGTVPAPALLVAFAFGFLQGLRRHR